MKQEKKQSKHTTVRAYIDTKQKLNYLAKANSQSVPKFLEELISELFPLCGEFKEVKILYEGRLDTHTLNVMVCPKSTYSFPVASLGVVSRKSKTEIPVSSLGIAKDEKFPKGEESD